MANIQLINASQNFNTIKNIINENFKKLNEEKFDYIESLDEITDEEVMTLDKNTTIIELFDPAYLSAKSVNINNIFQKLRQ